MSWWFQPLLPTSSSTPLYEIAGYRGRNDNGNETTATWIAAENTPFNVALDTTFRVRLVINNIGANDPAFSPLFQLQYRKNGGSWANVDGSSTNVRTANSPNLTNGVRTTSQLTSGVGSFFSGGGEIDDGDNSRTGGYNQAFPPNAFTEDEYVITLRSADISTADLVEFRVLVDAAAVAVETWIARVNGPTATEAPMPYVGGGYYG